jgi:hypothetical protein
VLNSVFKDGAPGRFFKITNAGPLLPPYLFHVLFQHPLEILAGGLLKLCSSIRKGLLNSPFGQSEAAKLRLTGFIKCMHYTFGWLAISGTYGAFRYAIVNKGVRNAIIVVHEACGAHEENLGSDGRDLWVDIIRQSAIDTQRKLSSLPASSLLDSWQLWYVSFSRREIKSFDQATKVWNALTVGEIEKILGCKLDVVTVSELFKEVWTEPENDGEEEHTHLAPHAV